MVGEETGDSRIEQRVDFALQVAVRAGSAADLQIRRQEFVFGAQRPDVNTQARRRARGAPSPVSRALARRKLHHHPFVRADGVGVAGDFLQARVAHQVEIAARVAGEREIERLAAWARRAAPAADPCGAQRLEIADLEGLDADRVGALAVAKARQRPRAGGHRSAARASRNNSGAWSPGRRRCAAAAAGPRHAHSLRAARPPRPPAPALRRKSGSGIRRRNACSRAAAPAAVRARAAFSVPPA